jgi:hypothetical protein
MNCEERSDEVPRGTVGANSLLRPLSRKAPGCCLISSLASAVAIFCVSVPRRMAKWQIECSGLLVKPGAGASAPLDRLYVKIKANTLEPTPLERVLFGGARRRRLRRVSRPAAVSLLCLLQDSYLVDPASSHMLVSKIKPCMSKYKRLYTVKLRMAH